MSKDNMRVAIETKLIEQVAAHHPDVDLQLSNAKFDRTTATYLTYTILEGKSARVNLGPGRWVRTVGVLQLDILGPENEGTGGPIRLAEWAGKLFDEWKTILEDDARLNFKVPAIVGMGVNQGFHREVVSIPYWRDEREAIAA